MSHGFLTIATGDEKYYKMAANLLQSYRYFSKPPLPFAILADRENEYTAKFDDVMLLENAHCNYLDKLSMLESLPYDVNIFIDADCIAYGDLNKLLICLRMRMISRVSVAFCLLTIKQAGSNTKTLGN